MLKDVIEILTILVTLSPILVQIFNLVTQKAHSQKIQNLRERATVIVTALEQTDWTNEEKQLTAFNKLSRYANEVGIKVTSDQIMDYIESSVKFMKALNK